jgi:hypothetical protein
MFGSRKFTVAILALFSLTTLCALGHIGEGAYVAGLVATVGAYITGNVAQAALTKDS